LELPPGATAFGMVTTGQTQLRDPETGPFHLSAGMFFVLPDGGVTCSGDLAIILPGYRGLRQIGGPLETAGRPRCIDGCSDTLPICFPRLGDPCLNHPHIPPRTDLGAGWQEWTPRDQVLPS
jgi:hypothetical protein